MLSFVSHSGMLAQQKKTNSASGMFTQNHVRMMTPQVIGVGGCPVQGARRYRWMPTLGDLYRVCLT
jgi:hypothetical protein